MVKHDIVVIKEWPGPLGFNMNKPQKQYKVKKEKKYSIYIVWNYINKIQAQNNSCICTYICVYVFVRIKNEPKNTHQTSKSSCIR